MATLAEKITSLQEDLVREKDALLSATESLEASARTKSPCWPKLKS